MAIVTWDFKGVITPPGLLYNLHMKGALGRRTQTQNPDLDYNLVFSNESVSVSVTCSDSVNVFELKNLVEHATGVPLDVANFLAAGGYELKLISAVCTDGRTQEFDALIGRLPGSVDPALCDARKLVQLANANFSLQLAIKELRLAIRQPWDTGFHSFRAVEDIRQHFVEPNEKDAKSSWERLRRALNMDRTYVELLQKFALEQRHGDGSTPMTGDERRELYNRAHILVNRFSQFLDGSGNDLDRSTFPELKA